MMLKNTVWSIQWLAQPVGEKQSDKIYGTVCVETDKQKEYMMRELVRNNEN